MFGDIHSEFYNYIRGAILILSVYHLFIYSQNRKKEFLFYSLYFFCISLFFLGQGMHFKDVPSIFHHATPTIHCGTFIFYLSFARVLLNTSEKLPNWDVAMVRSRWVTIVMALIFILVGSIFGFRSQSILFMVLGPMTLLFTLFCYWHFFKIKTYKAKFFLAGSGMYTLFANLSFFSGYIYGYEGFIEKSGVHPTIFMYVGTVLEAIVFSMLIGNSIAILENEKNETIKQIEHLKQIVVKNHIILKDKTKVYISDLIYVKAEDHYLNLFLSTGKNHLVRGKLSLIKEELPPNFIQCHRSYIVNANFIKQTSGENLTLINKDTLPISRTYKERF